MTPEEQQLLSTLTFQIQEEENYQRLESLLRQFNELVRRKLQKLGDHHNGLGLRRRAEKRLEAVAKQVMKPVFPNQPERLEIFIPDAEDLFREIRIENTFFDGHGNPLALKEGAILDLTLEVHQDGESPTHRLTKE